MAFQNTYRKSFILKEDFPDYLARRRESEDTLTFDIIVGKEKTFFHYDPDFIGLIAGLAEKNATLQSLYERLSPFAKEQMMKNCLINDIKNTNDIESIRSTRQEIFGLLNDARNKGNVRLVSIVNKYRLLLSNDEIPLTSCEAIRKIYDSLMAGALAKEDQLDGILFRKKTVGITNGMECIHQGFFPEERITGALQESLKILNDASLNPFIRLGLFHYLFEDIHPFYDGNGRMGRYLASVFIKENISSLFCFMVSSAIAEKRNEYYRAFKETEDPRNHGDLTTFVYPFLSILSAYYDPILQKLHHQMSVLSDYSLLLKRQYPSYSQSQRKLLASLETATLFSGTGLTARKLSDLTHCSYKTTLRAIAVFEKDSLLEKTTFGKTSYYQLKKDKED